MFLVMASSLPEYNNKIDQANLMAPVAFLGNTASKFYKTMSNYYSQIKSVCNAMGYHKITPQSLGLLEKAEYFCKGANPTDSNSCNWFTWFIGFDNVKPVRIFANKKIYSKNAHQNNFAFTPHLHQNIWKFRFTSCRKSFQKYYSMYQLVFRYGKSCISLN